MSIQKIITDFIDDLAVTAAKLANNLDLSGKSVTLANGEISAAELESTLDLSGKTLTLPAGGSRAGEVVQVVNTQTGAVATGTTTIPNDDTIPQNTEGTEFMTLAITPTSVTNKLKIDVVFFSTITQNQPIAVALFQDNNADALAAVNGSIATGGIPTVLTFTHFMTAGMTSETTFKVRAGASGAATMTFNGTGGNRRYGGVAASSITITEIKA